MRTLPWLDRYPNRYMAKLFINYFEYVLLLLSAGKGYKLVNTLFPIAMIYLVLEQKLTNELALDQIAGSFVGPTFVNFQLFPLGVRKCIYPLCHVFILKLFPRFLNE